MRDHTQIYASDISADTTDHLTNRFPRTEKTIAVFYCPGPTQCSSKWGRRSRSHLEEADDTGTPPTVAGVGFERNNLMLRDTCLNPLGHGCSLPLIVLSLLLLEVVLFLLRNYRNLLSFLALQFFRLFTVSSNCS